MFLTTRAFRLLVVPCLAIANGLYADEPANHPTTDESQVNDIDREHWAYLPVQRPPVPNVKNREWPRTPIDNFVLAKLEAEGWQPNPVASSTALLRRIYLDLIGLPPTISEQDRFAADPSAKRLDEVADRLLRRPGYGERWSRHWLDLVRYADSNGYERDAEKPHVWRFRDYVIDALNNDKPYNQFVLEQLAGDELAVISSETLIATGFYRLGSWDDEPADFAQDRHDQLDDIVRTTSQVFIGLSLGCARCHDHKFDALTMQDYYRMSAIVAPLQRPQSGRTDLDAPAGSAEQLAIVAERDRRLAELRGQQQKIRNTALSDFLASGKSDLPDNVLSAFKVAASKRNADQKKLAKDHQEKLDEEFESHFPSKLKQRIEAIERHIGQLRDQVPDLPRAYFLMEPEKQPAKSFLLLRGRAATPGPEVHPGLPAVLLRQQPLFEAGGGTSRRRIAMATWIASDHNPLTARVIVNRVWQYHFGEGIVRTPSDFGVMGDRPTHPELLDWLADWFVHDANWSLKKLHRLIVRSNTYRMSKSVNTAYLNEDPENMLLWRFPFRRLQVEALRDSVLAASGKLNRTMYGPGVKLDIPRVVVEGHADRDKVWQPSSVEEQSRRTVYAFVKRSLIVPLLEVLDLCDTIRSTERRNITSVAPQALTLFNGQFINQQASHLAERVIDEAGGAPTAQVTHAWRIALCRRPTESEQRAMVEFLKAERGRLQGETRDDRKTSFEDAHRLALIQVCRVIFNLNEFSYPN
jgi:hypothetical protein